MHEIDLVPQDMTLPPGYRMTELGPLPEEWRMVKLGEMLDEVEVRVKHFNLPAADSLPVLSLTKNEGLILQSERFEKRIATEKVDDYKVVRREQIVYNPYVIWEGAIHILDKYPAGIVSPVYMVFEVRKEFADPYFLDAWLRTRWAIAAYNSFAAGAVNRRRAIKKQDFKRIDIPLPPLPEQRAIAHVLRTIQRAKEATERVIAAARELKKSLMRHLFTYGPVPIDQADQAPMQETEIGPIPSHWRAVKLREVAQMKYGKAKPESSGSIPVIGSGGIYDWTSEALVSHPTIVIGRKGTAGKVWLAEVPCWPSDTTFYLVWKCSIDVRFFYYCLSHKPLSGEHAKTTLPSLQRQDLENYLVPLPPLSEQQEIARILKVVDEKIRAEEMRKQALEQLFKSLLHNLMTAKIRLPESFVKQFKEGEIHE